MKKNKSKQGVDVRQNILKAAGALMIQKGVNETSLKDIANEVGISKGTLYYYYSAKEDIIYDIADNHMNQITDELLSWIDSIKSDIAPEHILRTVFEKILEAELRGKLHLYLISDAIIKNNSLKQRFSERYEQWRRTLESGAEKVFKKRNIDYKVFSYVILAALDGLIIQRMLGADKIPVENIVRLLSDIG